MKNMLKFENFIFFQREILETILKYLDIGTVLSIFSIFLTIYGLRKYNSISQYNKIQKNQWKQKTEITLNNIHNKMNVIKQNNIVYSAKDNQSFIFAINKETLKNITIFIVVIICFYLAHRVYKCLSLKNSQDCIKN